jgi:hypothetical protein
MNLLSLVEQMTGAEYKRWSKKDGGEFSGPCPFCGGDDRFRIWPYHPGTPMWWCRQCGKKGGSVALMIQKHGVTAKKAKEMLMDMGYPLDSTDTERYEKKERILPAPSKHDFGEFVGTIEMVEHWHNTGKEQAAEYLTQFGLTMQDVERHQFGWAYYQGVGRLIIPHWWIDENGNYILKGIKFRVMTDNKKFRFSAVDGSITRGVWNPKWVSNPDRTRNGPILNYVFILEAEKDAALLDGLGYPAVSYHPETAWNQHLNHVYHNVIMPIIAYDEDGGKGLNRALQIAECLKSRPAIVSTKAWNVKSPSDLAQDYGRDAVVEWINSLKLEIEPYEKA